MRSILVTGANKGIGLAIVEAILQRHDDTHVYLGSRDRDRGRVAAEQVAARVSGAAGRVVAVPLDVTSDASVAAAVDEIRRTLGGPSLYAVVNNAGVQGDIETILATNLFGVKRISEAFLSLLAPSDGRLVNVTSGAAPSFVQDCSEEKKRIFRNAQITWEEITALVSEFRAAGGDDAAARARGFAGADAYGFSKACANAYTQLFAREHPTLVVNACTPGFIETDLTRQFYMDGQKSAAELGMKSPAEGARAPMHLLFATLEGNGRYYGSDAQRSPLDRYRAPGSAPYQD